MNTFILFLLFLILLYVFYLFYGLNLSKFIGKLNYNLYIYSTIISIISFLIVYFYILIKDDKKSDYNIFLSILLMLISAILWVISSYYNMKLLNIFFIFLICIFNIYLLYLIINVNERENKILKYISILVLYYLLFHHIFIDLILWNYFNF